MFIDSEDIKRVIPEVIKIRRHIHMYPEISEHEYETSKYIKKCLEEIGLEANFIGDTGVVSMLMNNPEFQTVGLRAEMDALPIEEETNLEFKSKNKGVMHACSHDGIVATALGVTRLLYEHKDELKCNVKFIFEPAEEVGKGAKKLIAAGFASWFSQLSKTYGEMRKNNHQVNEFRSIVDEEKERLERKKIPTDGFDELEIVFDNVSYCYPGTEKKVLDQISFRWGKGEHLALVGLNGAGKSTLVKLICGFYVPTNGRVLVNGVDTRELNLTEYFKHLSAVFQNEWILSYTIAENVAMGKDWEEDRIWEALKLAKIDSVVKALPNGIFTYLGKEIDQSGVLLSGGELQKLFWARALYRNPKLILLDEPTAALDALAEDQLYQAYHKMTEKKSAMFISHRLASTRFCDTILMLENGKIVESGTHEELLAKKGSYAKLFEVQSRYYREGQENG